ncbi:MAG: hypothetical protein RL094_17 [Candidatus Parcubacteria bacterium]|jgi:hypothetical protein
MDKDTNRQKDNQNILTLAEISIFDNDHYFSYIYKKSEKIAAALYMITDFLSDSEPLKTEIRLNSLSLINKTLELNTSASSERKNLLSKIIQNSLSLISFSQIAVFSGIVSVMNHQIVKRELELFIKTIEDRESPNKLGRNFVLSSEFIKDDLIVQMNKSQSVQKPVSEPVRPHFSSNNPIQPKIQPVQKEGKNDRKNERQELIIATIRAKGELSIRDLSLVIKGCSEKTIQRELLALVEANILTKSGERRWSRYSLAN